MEGEKLNGVFHKGRKLTAAPAKSGFFCEWFGVGVEDEADFGVVVNGQIVANGEDVKDTASAGSSSEASSPKVDSAEAFPPPGGRKSKQGKFALSIETPSSLPLHLNRCPHTPACPLSTNTDDPQPPKTPPRSRQRHPHSPAIRQAKASTALAARQPVSLAPAALPQILLLATLPRRLRTGARPRSPPRLRLPSATLGVCPAVAASPSSLRRSGTSTTRLRTRTLPASATSTASIVMRVTRRMRRSEERTFYWEER
jgi:hypothetical protein